MFKSKSIFVLVIFALIIVVYPVAVFAQDEMEFDEPGSEDILNRQLWEFAKGSPYDSVMSYVHRAQERSRGKMSNDLELPTGWKLGPAGKQVEVGRLPFEAIMFNGKLVVLNTGYYVREPQEISVVDPSSAEVIKTEYLTSIFPSARIGKDGNLYVSGGFDSSICMINKNFEFQLQYNVGGYAAGLAPVDSSHIAIVCLVAKDSLGRYDMGKIELLNLKNGEIENEAVIGYFPYDVQLVNGKYYVTLLGENRVNVYDTRFQKLDSIDVGSAPEEMTLSGNQIYVVNTTSDDISVIDVSTDRVVRTIFVGKPGYKSGVSPTSCSVYDGKLFVSEATLNAVAVFELSTGELLGYIPSGWYTTKVVIGGGDLFALSAKGIIPRRPNPAGPQPIEEESRTDYVLTLLRGSVGIVPLDSIGPNLSAWTKIVEEGSPEYSPWSGMKLPIKHVFYIIKENRSYDQVLGDLGRGNGDSSLTIFGRAVTPNVHKIATDFVTLDNFFADGEMSVLGHSFTTSGYASPFLEWLGNAEYSHKYKGYPFGTVPVVYSRAYIWDALEAAHLDYRIYGEPYYIMTAAYKVIRTFFGDTGEIAKKFYANSMDLASKVDRGAEFSQFVESFYGKASTVSATFSLLGDTTFTNGISRVLTGDLTLSGAINSDTSFKRAFAEFVYHYPLNYYTWDLWYSDLRRFESWKTDFDAQVKSGSVVPFEYIWLPNDHTGGTDPNYQAPYQLVAQNDIALGLILNTISNSPIWRSSLILVEEDDAQNGPDHVDATRTEALAAGPYVKRSAVVDDRYDQLSMLRTVELILGLDPLNFEDAMAVPMFGIFSNASDTTRYNPAPPSGYLSESDRFIFNRISNGMKDKK
ncbi:MAG TPA: hypothetical protein VIS48_09965 [Candidatus Kryptonia bacterium]